VTPTYTEKKLCLTVFLVALNLFTPVFAAAADEPKATPRFEVQEHTNLYTDRTFGFTLQLPNDFRLSSEQGDLLYFQSPERSGTMIVRTVPGLSLSTVQERLRNGLEAESITIKPTGSPETLQLQGAQGLIMNAGGTMQGREIFGKLAGVFGPNGQGYMILIGSVKERWLGFEGSANRMVNSFEVIEARPGFEHERWKFRLAGTRLVYFDRQGNYIRGAAYAEQYTFCRDGTFRSRLSSAQTESDAWARYTSSTGRKRKGDWSISYEGNYPYLILSNNRGPQQSFALSQSEGRITMDDVPFLFATNEICP